MANADLKYIYKKLVRFELKFIQWRWTEPINFEKMKSSNSRLFLTSTYLIWIE